VNEFFAKGVADEVEIKCSDFLRQIGYDAVYDVTGSVVPLITARHFWGGGISCVSLRTTE